MDGTNQVPNVPLNKLKRTKIIATVGPSTHSYEGILQLIKGGANGLRLNFSHGIHEERIDQIKWIRKASRDLGKPVAVIQDLHGPKMQLGKFEGIVNVQTGQNLSFSYNANYEETGILPTQFDFSKKVKRGQRLLLYDGKVRTIITSVKNGVVYTTAENEGILIKGKGINLPDTNFEGDIITAKDKADLAFGSTQDYDYVALSFIQSADDVRAFRKILKGLNSTAQVIAKIETPAAVQNIEEIVQEADALMVARGDLAVETLPESVPIVQRKIIDLGIRYAKPTIVATQMMSSMTEAPEPTRAEVSDVATATLLGADCVMLSEETAAGKFPIETVRFMKRVIRYSEDYSPLRVPSTLQLDTSRQGAICSSVIMLAQNLKAAAIVAETQTGATAHYISACRPQIPIVAVTSDRRVAQQLAIVYGTRSYIRPNNKLAATKLTNWLQENKVLHKGDIVVTASGQYPGAVGATDTIKVRVLQ